MINLTFVRTIKCPEKFPQSPDVLVKDQKIEKEIWTTAPMYDKPIEYNCALGWARKIGEAARMGYSVVFRQPQRGELFADTHVLNTLINRQNPN